MSRVGKEPTRLDTAHMAVFNAYIQYRHALVTAKEMIERGESEAALAYIAGIDTTG